LKQVDVNNIDPGIQLCGVSATHPITGKTLPIFVTSYVHADYGTGCIMGVPFHDERDQAFALEWNLTMIEVVNEEGKLVNSAKFNGQTF
jgi:leucyl-tRNA synthetase